MRDLVPFAAAGLVVVLAWRLLGRRRRPEPQRPAGPGNLVAVLLDSYWRSLADDPLATLLLMALVSTAGVLLFLLWHVVTYLFGQLAAVL